MSKFLNYELQMNLSEYMEGCSGICGNDCGNCDNCPCLVSGLAYEDRKLKALFIHNSRPAFECHDACKCSPKCPSRLTQFLHHWPFLYSRVVSENVGVGVFSSKNIPVGSFICRYEGKYVTGAKSSLDAVVLNLTQNMNHNYLMVFLEKYGAVGSNTDDSRCVVTCIDAANGSGFGRLINHSCDPNLMLIPVRIGDSTPEICIFALRNIQVEEELTYNYSCGAQQVQLSNKPCECGAVCCKGHMPSVSI